MDVLPPLFVAKWKMHKDAAATASFFETFRPLIGSSERCDVVICPPFLGLEAAVGATRGTGILIGVRICTGRKKEPTPVKSPAR